MTKQKLHLKLACMLERPSTPLLAACRRQGYVPVYTTAGVRRGFLLRVGDRVYRYNAEAK